NYEGCFEGVWACASLLHLPKTMLSAVLFRLRTALVSGGVMFASVQEGEGEGFAPDGRFFAHYGPIEFRRAVEGAGFAIKDLWTSDDLLAGRSATRWINVLARKS